MDEKKVLDLEAITAECKILDELGADVVVENIDGLEKQYDEDDLVNI